MNGEYAEWSKQVNETLAALARRVERLDTHSAELAREVLDVIERVDALETRLGRQIETVADRLEGVQERASRELDYRIETVERRLEGRR